MYIASDINLLLFIFFEIYVEIKNFSSLTSKNRQKQTRHKTECFCIFCNHNLYAKDEVHGCCLLSVLCYPCSYFLCEDVSESFRGRPQALNAGGSHCALLLVVVELDAAVHLAECEPHQVGVCACCMQFLKQVSLPGEQAADHSLECNRRVATKWIAFGAGVARERLLQEASASPSCHHRVHRAKAVCSDLLPCVLLVDHARPSQFESDNASVEFRMAAVLVALISMLSLICPGEAQ